MNHRKADAAERKRTDPLKTVVDRDLMRMAMDLHRLKQNEEYWKTSPVPKRPYGQMRCESLLQIGVFALPLAAYITVAQHFGYGHALYGVLFYHLLFRRLERALSNAIFRKRLKEEDLDRGRYAFTKILGERLGLKPEEVTLEVVLKMTCDFVILVIYGRNMPTEKKDAIMRRTYEFKDLKERLNYILFCFEETKEFAPVEPKAKVRQGGTGADHGTSAATYAGSSRRTYDDHDDEPVYSQVNPTTGLPMVNSVIDVGGNVYGQGNFGEL
jgi:hypothetical protein